MCNLNKIVTLFDFDGVIMDTESQYTLFWNRMGEEFLGVENFGPGIKGQTMVQIYDRYFKGKPDEQRTISEHLYAYEHDMSYEYIPGAVSFIDDLRAHEVKVAIVTSSDERKMALIYDRHPELKTMVDVILTGERFARSKPAPDCFLLGMEQFEASPKQTFVFEDSFHGLKAGMDSGATVVGLATTNSREAISDHSHFVIDDFTRMTYSKLVERNFE